MLGEIFGATSAAAGLGQGIAALLSHNKLADVIGDQQKTIPSSLFKAEDILQQLAFEGIPGMENIIAELESSMPSSINQLKELAVSPSGLLGAASGMQESLNKNIREVLLQDAATKSKNRANLAQFQASSMAPAEMRVEDFNIEKAIMEQQERFAGVSELFEALGGSIGGGINAYGSGKLMELLNKDTLAAYFNA